jgi:hypothetical protein
MCVDSSSFFCSFSFSISFPWWLPSLLRNKFVSNPMHGQQMLGTSGILLDFLAQSRDVIVYRAITRTLALGPDSSDQLLTGEHNFRPGYEELENFELLQSQLHRLIPSAKLHFAEIQRELTELRHFACSARQKGRHIRRHIQFQCFDCRKTTFEPKLAPPALEICH